jgi:hypothetical protein
METLKISEIADLVCDILSKKRVGFLWYGTPKQIPEIAGFSWIHYYWHANAAANAIRTYNLSELRDPLSEGNTLDMLVIPGGTIGIILEIASKITVSSPSKLTEGALRSGIPVIFEASALRKRIESSDEGKLQALLEIIRPLKDRGMIFVGLENEPSLCCDAAETGEKHAKPNIVTLRGSWLSWNEISRLVLGAESVRLAAGTKLTPEARDRLLKLNIHVEEAF